MIFVTLSARIQQFNAHGYIFKDLVLMIMKTYLHHLSFFELSFHYQPITPNYKMKKPQFYHLFLVLNQLFNFTVIFQNLILIFLNYSYNF